MTVLTQSNQEFRYNGKELSEEQKVAHWRFESFQKLLPKEYDELKISILVCSDSSPHDLEKLIKEGCEIDLAVEILS